jgi:DNA-binding Lrp family transcriptional regulator
MRASARREPGAGVQTIFVMVKCELGETYNVAAQAVDEIEQVSEVHSISGQFDLLMKCALDQGVDVGHFIAEKIQKVPGIKDTFTLITFKAFS